MWKTVHRAKQNNRFIGSLNINAKISLMTSYQSHGHPINHGLPAGSTSSMFSEIKMKRRQLLFKQNCSLSELLLSPHSVAANYLHEFSILTKINWIAFSKAHLLLWPGVIFLWMSPTLSNLWSILKYPEKNRGDLCWWVL